MSEYNHQRVIIQYDYKFECQQEGCPLYPCYSQKFCDGLSAEGKTFLGIEGACVAKKIVSICETNGKKNTTWEEVLCGLGEQRDLEVDRPLESLEGEISSFKRTLNGIEKNHDGLSPQIIGRGVTRLFKNIWLVYTDKFTVAKNLTDNGYERRGRSANMTEQGAQRRTTKKGVGY